MSHVQSCVLITTLVCHVSERQAIEAGQVDIVLLAGKTKFVMKFGIDQF